MPVLEHDPAEWQRLAQQYRDYARHELTIHGSPIYAAICARLADDRAIGSLALEAQPGFRTPLILLAAVHQLLLSGLQHALATYYPSLVGATMRAPSTMACTRPSPISSPATAPQSRSWLRRTPPRPTRRGAPCCWSRRSA